MSSGREGPVIVAVCGDAGGASAVAPVLAALRAEGRVRVDAFAYRQAADVWTKRKVDYEKVSADMAKEAVEQRLRDREAALLITGTSFDPSLEKKFIAAARALRVPSLAVLDFWSNYALRFADVEGRLAYLPDRIAVMDERARDEMAAAGFDPALIVVTGNPALDELASRRGAFTELRRQAIREELRVAPDELLVVFGSQRIAYPDERHTLYPGFTRESVLAGLIAALDVIAEQRGKRVVLVVRPHPSEEGENFECRSRSIRVLVFRQGDSRDLVLAADLVTGISSTFLIEACHLGCVTMSLQPGLRLPDALSTNRSGLSRAVYRQDEMKPAIEAMLLDAETRQAAHARLSNLRVQKPGTEEVLKLTYQMAGVDGSSSETRARCHTGGGTLGSK